MQFSLYDCCVDCMEYNGYGGARLTPLKRNRSPVDIKLQDLGHDGVDCLAVDNVRATKRFLSEVCWSTIGSAYVGRHKPYLDVGFITMKRAIWHAGLPSAASRIG